MNTHDFIQKGAGFASCTFDRESAGVVMFGAGYDGTSSNRAGSKFAPSAIRSESRLGMEDFSPWFRRDVTELPIHDLGDILFDSGDKEDSLKRIQLVAESIVSENKIPVMIGGEHLVSLPVVQTLFQRYPDLCIVHLDAHLDMIDVLYGSRISHGTVMRRIYDMIGQPGRIIQAGIRSGSAEEFAFVENKTTVLPFSFNGLPDAVSVFAGRPVYLTVDIDGFTPQLIRGTGTPEAGGGTFEQFMEFLTSPAFARLKIVGMDLVELAPELDTTHVSSVIAAQILREMLCAGGLQRSQKK